MAFIPNKKFNQLREDSKNGNELAKAILHKYLNNEDYANDLDEYFAPKNEPVMEEEVAPKVEEVKEVEESEEGKNNELLEWLRDNNISKNDEDYEEAVEEYYNEYPNQRPKEEEKEIAPVTENLVKDEHKAIDAYEKAKQEISQMDILEKDTILAIIDHIKEEEEGHVKELQEALELAKGHEETEAIPSEEEMVEYKSFAKDFINLISRCDKIYLTLMENEDIDDNARRGMLATVDEIKKALLDSVDKIKKLKEFLNKDEKPVETPVVE